MTAWDATSRMTAWHAKNMPPPILTSEPDSFARRTFEVRVPQIILDTIGANDFPIEIAQALHALRDEILSGAIQPLRAPAPDAAFWEEHARPYLGKRWLEVPWYWAEAYLYRRILEATRYFQPGEWYHRDPYARQKQAELGPEAGLHALQAIQERLPRWPQDRFRALLYASLWGNRSDLSYTIAQDAPGSLTLENEHANLVVDDAAPVWEHLLARHGGQVSMLCDNAGTELLFDLALVDFFLGEGLARRATLYLKPEPFFVSDAMVKDAEDALAALAGSPVAALSQLAQRLHKKNENGDLVFAQRPFLSSCLFYFEMPQDMHRALGNASLVIAKGDANYRRLLGDCHWLPTTPFAGATAYFPAPLVALRTLKSELIVGLGPGRADEYARQDAAWLTNGKRGLVQFRSR